MGPIALFDKSFIQSLSLDESVWFDHFFITNVCPLFFVETLADLEKSGIKGRTASKEVQIIAKKFPEMSSAPCAHHVDLSLSNLMGYDVPMIGQIPLQHGKLVIHDGKYSSFSEDPPVAQAFSRWQQEQYLEIEQIFAKKWRQSLTSIDLAKRRTLYKYLHIDEKECRTLRDAKDLAVSVISSIEAPFLRMAYALEVLSIPESYHSNILSRWVSMNYPSITEFAPYTAYVLSIELFFEIALESQLISTKPSTNRIDLAYLFYLPFCMIFISSDRFHRTIAPLFLRENQEFVWGLNLKASFKEINFFFSLYPDSEKEKGLHSFAPTPPKFIENIVTDLWDRHIPSWRVKEESSTNRGKKDFSDIISKVEEIQKSQPVNPDPSSIKARDIESSTIKRRVKRKKGAWYQVPKDLDKK